MSILYTIIILSFISYTASHLEASVPPAASFLLPLSKACKVGAVAVNDCNQCICTSDHYFNCVSKKCNQNVNENLKDKDLCEPDKLYVNKFTACICKQDGSWSHKLCKTAFGSIQTKSENRCEPNNFIIVGCNVCKCGANGIINNQRCTKNKCKPDVSKSRRYIKQNHQVYGSCKSGNWYSLAPCQFCYCISENKLVCNTGNNYSKKLQLGSYNLSVCGKDLIKDALSLVPDYNNNLRLGTNDTVDELDDEETTTEYHSYKEINLVNKKKNKVKTEKKKAKVEKKSEDYSTDSDETKAPVASGREPLSTRSPYEEEDNNVSSELDSVRQVPSPVGPVSMDIEEQSSAPTDAPANDIRPPPRPDTNDEQQLQWSGLTAENGQIPNEAFNLGDVLKPYLPVVLDKVFQMALRKSMVSINAQADCTPGSTTVYKCNACFCMKNNKLLCTKNECK